MTNVRNETEDTTTDSTNSKRIIRNIMDKFMSINLRTKEID